MCGRFTQSAAFDLLAALKADEGPGGVHAVAYAPKASAATSVVAHQGERVSATPHGWRDSRLGDS